MTLPVAILIVCSFAGANGYDCAPSESWDSWEECEETAANITESKGLHAYCIKFEKPIDGVNQACAH